MTEILPLNKPRIATFFLLALVLTFLPLSKVVAQGGVIKTVVIDAGHGGKDPGCNGSHSNEKTVCLNMALGLGEMISKAYPDVKVVYTRDKDVFVELDDRAKIANKNKADLFICIHANSASPSAYGAETYVLGLHRSEAQQKIAERENSTIYLEADGGSKYKDYDMSPDAMIARQLQLSVNLDHSINYATKVQTQFKKMGRHDRGVKQAGFLVLYKTTMPSVLIETGFLTNREEENFLSAKENQRRMSEAMFEAFVKYKTEMEGGVNTALPLPKVETPKTPVTTQKVEPAKVEPKKEHVSKEETKVVVNEPAKPTTTNVKTETEKKEVVKVFKEEIAEKKENIVASDQVIFRVQIHTSPNKLKSNDSVFKGLEIFEYFQDKIYKYTTGYFENDYKAANNLKNNVRAQGFQHAFVVAFLNGERINLEKAIKLAEK